MTQTLDAITQPLDDTRESMRRHVLFPAQIVVEDGFWRVSNRILDLSTTGLLAECWADVPVGTRTFVAFRPPASQVWVDAEAVVTRLLGGRRRGDQTRAIALQFESLDRVSKALLGAKLRGYPPPVPSRPVRSRLDYAAFVRRAALPC
jgi:hypothetical protein